LRGFPPLPSAAAGVFGLELAIGPALARVEAAHDDDDSDLWYWHYIYTAGYTTRGKVMGHPMGGDSRSVHADLEVAAGRWGLLTAGWSRVQHGFETLRGVSPRLVDPPVPHAEHDELALRVEKYWGPFPGAVTAEVRRVDARGDVDAFEATERWGVTLGWRQAAW
jgi:hypothetical protein